MADAPAAEREATAERSLAVAPANAELVPTELTALAVEASGKIVTRAQVEVLRRTICAKLDDNQLLLYLARCGRQKLDPFTMAYAFPSGEGGLSMGLRIDGMRALAMATGEYDSRVVETLFQGEGAAAKLVGARCTIQRKGMLAPVVEEAYLGEYDTGKFLWATHKETMIRKVAESKALRAAFPDALAGLYEPSEME